jgi:hypothetical protein
MPRHRELLLFTALLAAGIAVACWAARPSQSAPLYRRVPTYTDGQIDAIFARERSLEREMAARQRFVEVRRSTARALLDGAGLERAVSRAHSAALVYYPKLLTYLPFACSGTTHRERVARYLLDHLEDDLSLSSEPAGLLRQLRQRLESAAFQRWCAAEKSKS